MVKRIFSLFFALVLCISLFSCGGKKLSEEEVKQTVRDLIAKSYEINEIFFGAGLPADRESLSYAEDTGDDAENGNGALAPVRYLPVLSPKYSCVEDLKTAAGEVYTESYLKSVFSMAFEGIADSEKQEIYQYAKYIDSYGGELLVRDGLSEESITCGRTYDAETLEITGQTGSFVFFTLESFINGESAGKVDLSIKDEGNGWRLDSPTY